MGLLPTSTILTNEIKLYDFKGTKASLTFGDADINDGYSYLRINFRADDFKFDFWQDKPIINFIADEEIMFNDKKIWHENNDGPMSGLNADMLDGLHATSFKDRNGHHHFGHAFLPGGAKMFVKIATFTPRRVGNAPDFNTDGTVPFQGTFAQNIVKRMEAQAKFEAFAEDTPENLTTTGIGAFEHTDMASEGVYNSTLRASISILRKGSTTAPPWSGPETVDIHVGLFEDPTNLNDDGWACTSKYFYVSNHNNNLPFIKAHDDPRHNYLIGGNVTPMSEGTLSSRIETLDTNTATNRAAVTEPSYSHGANDHSRPGVTGAGYIAPPDPTKNDYRAQRFPELIEPGFGYQKNLEAFRLYHVDSHVDTIDGVKIVTHRFDLYMAVDTKTELHVQPYMSSSCLFYNYQKPISEAELPQSNFLMPKSIYDNRYSHVEHRHRNYEQKIEDMDEEIEDIWQAFDNYVPIKQGVGNANKVLMTNSSGHIVCEIDNIERHQDGDRYKCRVMVSDKNGCIVESTITTTNLAQLSGIRANIQQQLDELNAELGNVPDGDAYVKKIGDTMTGNLKMTNGSTVAVSDTDNSIQSRLTFTGKGGYAGLYDTYEQSSVCGLDTSQTSSADRVFFIQKKTFKVGGKTSGAKVTVSSSAPTSPAVGDIWIKNK